MFAGTMNPGVTVGVARTGSTRTEHRNKVSCAEILVVGSSRLKTQSVTEAEHTIARGV